MAPTQRLPGQSLPLHSPGSRPGPGASWAETAASPGAGGPSGVLGLLPPKPEPVQRLRRMVGCGMEAGWVLGTEIEVDSEMETGWRLGWKLEAWQSGRGSGWALSGTLTPGNAAWPKSRRTGLGCPRGMCLGSRALGTGGQHEVHLMASCVPPWAVPVTCGLTGLHEAAVSHRGAPP